MKQMHLPIKSATDSPKALLKKLDLSEKKDRLQKKNTKRLRIVQAINAGRVRGGHSFH